VNIWLTKVFGHGGGTKFLILLLKLNFSLFRQTFAPGLFSESDAGGRGSEAMEPMFPIPDQILRRYAKITVLRRIAQ